MRTFFHFVLAALISALAYAFFLGARSDYLGHYLAGFGATLLILLPLAAMRRPWGFGIVLVVAAAIAAGAILENSVFRFAIYDPVDFANQSLGAVMAGACVAGRRGSIRSAGLLGIGAVVLIAAGFRYAFG